MLIQRVEAGLNVLVHAGSPFIYYREFAFSCGEAAWTSEDLDVAYAAAVQKDIELRDPIRTSLLILNGDSQAPSKGYWKFIPEVLAEKKMTPYQLVMGQKAKLRAAYGQEPQLSINIYEELEVDEVFWNAQLSLLLFQSSQSPSAACRYANR